MKRAQIVPLLVLSLAAVTPLPAAAGVKECAIAKLKASTVKTQQKLKCYLAAVKHSAPVDPACLAKAEQKFDTAFAKAQAKGPCNSQSATNVEAQINVCVNRIVDVSSQCLGPQLICTNPGECCSGICTPDFNMPNIMRCF